MGDTIKYRKVAGFTNTESGLDLDPSGRLRTYGNQEISLADRNVGSNIYEDIVELLDSIGFVNLDDHYPNPKGFDMTRYTIQYLEKTVELSELAPHSPPGFGLIIDSLDQLMGD